MGEKGLEMVGIMLSEKGPVIGWHRSGSGWNNGERKWSRNWVKRIWKWLK